MVRNNKLYLQNNQFHLERSLRTWKWELWMWLEIRKVKRSRSQGRCGLRSQGAGVVDWEIIHFPSALHACACRNLWVRWPSIS